MTGHPSTPRRAHGLPCRLPRAVLGRRDLLRASVLSAGFLALGPVGRRLSEAAGAPLPNHRRLVVVNLSGGCDTLSVVVPSQLASYAAQRGAIAIPAVQLLGLKGAKAYGLHPSMPEVAALWNAGDALAVQRVGYPRANLSHFESQDVFSYGVRNGFGPLGAQPSGWIARFADLYAPTPLGAVSVGMGRPLDFVGGASNPLLVSSLAGFKVSGTGGSNARQHRIAAAKGVLEASSTAGLTSEARASLRSAHDLTSEVATALAAHDAYLPSSGVVWPATTIAKRMRDVAALIHGGFETRIFYTGAGGYDTHGGQGTTAGTGALPTLLADLDGALGAFAAEMRALGLWSDVVVLVITEFGRRNEVNGSAGTDHGHAFTALALGGRVRGAASHGPDLTDADLTLKQGYPDYAVDFRSLYREILEDHLGTDPAPVFPEPLEIGTTLGIV